MTSLEVVNKYLKDLGMCKEDSTWWKQLMCKGSAGGLLGLYSLKGECLIPAHPGVHEKVP